MSIKHVSATFSENPLNTDTPLIRTIWLVPLVSVLTGFHCIYKGSSSLDLMQTSSETVIFAGKAYLKINLLVKTLLHEFMAVGRSG